MSICTKCEKIENKAQFLNLLIFFVICAHYAHFIHIEIKA